MAKKDVLGRNLYDLFEDNKFNGDSENRLSLKVSDIEPRKDQPRKDFDQKELEVLADSILEYGVLQPIIVRENISFDGKYEIVAGERRWRAAKMAGLDEIPVVVLSGENMKMAQISMVENIVRKNLNPIEEATGYSDLITAFGLSQEEIAKQVGKSRSAIANSMRLLDLPDEIAGYVKDGTLSAGHARTLLGLEDKSNMSPLAKKIIEKDLSVRETEKAVKDLNAASKNEAETDEEVIEKINNRKTYMKSLEKKIMDVLGRKAKISYASKKKKLEISFDNDEDLENLLNKICGSDFFSDISV